MNDGYNVDDLLDAVNAPKSRYSVDELVNAIQTPETAQPEAQAEEEMGLMGYAGDMMKGVGEGAVKAVEETAQFGFDVVKWFDELDGSDDIADRDFDFVPEWLETKTAGGKMISGVSRFLTGFVGAGKVLKATKIAGGIAKLGKGAKYVQSAVLGAVADAVVFDPHEERFSNLIQEFPLLRNPVTEYLAADPEDGGAEGRFKNVLEGIGLGVLTDAMFVLVKGKKAALSAKTPEEYMEAVVKSADETEAALQKASTQADKIRALGLEPTESVVKADIERTVRNTGFDIEMDADALVSRMKEVGAKGREIDAPPAGRGYERGDMLNTEGIKTQDGKNLVQAQNDLSRSTVDRSTIDPKTWAEAEATARDFVKEAYGGPGIFDRLRGTANVADKLDETIVMGKIAIDDAAAKIRNVYELMEQTPAGDALTGLEKRMETIIRNAGEVSAYMERIKTGTGRGLNMFKNVGYENMDMGEMWEEAVKQLQNAPASQKRAIYARFAAVADNPAQLAKMLRVNPKSGRFWALHNELWINSLLSGPTTQMVNAITSGLKLAVVMPLDKMAGGWGGFKGGFFNIADKELFEEGAHAWGAMLMHFKDSAKMWAKALKSGESILKTYGVVEHGNKKAWSAAGFGMEADKGLGKAIEAVGKIINLPSRFLLSTDELVSQLAYRSNLQIKLQQTARKMVEAGRLADDPKAIAQFIQDNFDLAFLPKKLANGDVIEQGAATVKDALREAMDANFATPLDPKSLGFKISNAVKDHPYLTPIIPFIRTPLNILSDVAQHTPGIAKLSRRYRDAIAQGGKAAALAEGRLRTGGVMWAMGIAAATMGNITGGGPKNPVQREALLATGWRPYSIKIGDKYVSYNRLDPYGMFLGLSADFMDIAASKEDDAGIMDVAGAMMFTLAKNLTSKTYLQGLSEALEAVHDPDRNAGWWLKQRALSYLPAFSGQMRKVSDPEMKQLETMLDRFKDKVPGLSKDLPTKYSWLTGKPVLYHGGIASGLSPIVWSTGEKGKEIIGKELSKYAEGFSQPPKTYKGVKLNAQQISEFHRLHGTLEIGGMTLEHALLDLFNSPSYDREGKSTPQDDDPITGHRTKMIRSTIEQYRKAALQELFFNDEELQKGVEKVRIEKSLGRIRSYV